MYILIKELKYNNTINAKYLLDYLGENKAILELTDEQIIENIMGNDKEDNSIVELVSYKDTLKATITLHNFLLHYENTIHFKSFLMH